MEVEGEDWLTQIENDLNNKFDQLVLKYEQTNSLKEKESIKSLILKFYSKVYSLSSKIFQLFDPSKLTPFRSNLYDSHLILTNIENRGEEQWKKNFIKEFWTFCEGHQACFSRVPLKLSLTTYERYQDMKKKIKARSIGAILANFKVERNGKRQVFRSRFASFPICKPFFFSIIQLKEKSKDYNIVFKETFI